MTLMLHVPD